MNYPDCRAEGPYNENNLSLEDQQALNGYDLAVDELENFFANLDVYPEVEDILDPDMAIVNRDKATILKEALLDWFESKRNEMISTTIEQYDTME